MLLVKCFLCLCRTFYGITETLQLGSSEMPVIIVELRQLEFYLVQVEAGRKDKSQKTEEANIWGKAFKGCILFLNTFKAMSTSKAYFWYIRSPDEHCIDRDYYDEFEDVFTIELHYECIFTKKPGRTYKEGFVNYVDCIQPHEFNYPFLHVDVMEAS